MMRRLHVLLGVQSLLLVLATAASVPRPVRPPIPLSLRWPQRP